MTDEPELRNEVSGQVSGSAWQIGHVHGDLNNTVNNIHHHAAAAEPEPRLDFWLVLAGVIAVLNGLIMIIASIEGRDGLPLFGAGAVLDAHLFLDSARLGGPAKVAACCLGVWQVWSALDLFSRKKQADQRDRSVAQIAFWMSFVPVYLAVGVHAEWVFFCFVATAVALACAVRRPLKPRPGRWTSAVVTGVIAGVTWFAPEVHALWSDRADASVLPALVGTLLLLVIVAVPVHAVMTVPPANAARTLRAWSFCLALKFGITVLIAQYGEGVPGGSVVFAWWLPIIGIGAMLLATSSIRERVSAPGA